MNVAVKKNYDHLNLFPTLGNRFFEDFFDDVQGQKKFNPRVDIQTDEKSWMLTFEVPGFTQDAIKVEFENKVLTVKGEKKDKKEEHEGKRKYLRKEIASDLFERSFELGDEIDENNIIAHLNDGLLTVTIAKKEKAKPKTIPILGKSGQ